ncbi:MAG: hypothetical protein AB7F51_16905 [Pseudorhodoplanes sp.]
MSNLSMKLLAILLLAILPVALAGCAGGPGGPGGLTPPQRVCEGAAQAGAAADVIAQGLIAAGIAPAKVSALVPLIQTGRLLVTATCAILVPPAPST